MPSKRGLLKSVLTLNRISDDVINTIFGGDEKKFQTLSNEIALPI